jgi:hypothetical protein
MSFIKQKQIQNLTADLASKANVTQVLAKSSNLSDLPDVMQARTNLDVHSKAEVQALIAGAQNAYSVADLSARAALTGLKVTDRVFVADDGDGKWALYIVLTATDGQGSTCEYQKVADQDVFDNAMTASAVKAAYESNGDTNAFTDAEKAKLGLVSVEAPIDLDELQASVEGNSSSIGLVGTTATNALNAANAAQTTADGKEDEFSEEKEFFTGMTVEPNQDISMDVRFPVKQGHQVHVYHGAVRVHDVIWVAGTRTIIARVPYLTEASDTIYIVYAH